MKIIKLLFLGIVLVLFNIAYLAAQAPPDTVFVKSSPVAPGGVLTVTFEVAVHSEKVGGITIGIQGIPAEITPVGDDWYTWGEGYGSVLAVKAGLQPNYVALDEVGLQVVLLSLDLDGLVSSGDLASKSGVLISYMLQVPGDMELGTYPLSRVSEPLEIVVFQSFPFTGATLEPLPAVVADPIRVMDIPDYNALELPEADKISSTGGVLSLPINVLNKEDIGSGSFKISYPADALTLTGVTAGARAGGMDFTIAETTTDAGVAISTIEFSGGNVSLGGLEELCTLDFALSAVSSGTTLSISLADVSLSDAAGTALADVQQPTVDTTEPEVIFGDSLVVGVISGAHQVGEADELSGIAVIENGQLFLPILLKNSKPVSVLEFYITKTRADESVTLTLSEIQKTDRIAADFMLDATTVKDTADYIHLFGFQNPAGDPIAAGSGELLTLVFDIADPNGVIDENNPLDVTLELRGVELLASDGTMLTVQEVDGVATLDFRVPADVEGLGGGATLPKTFALEQNSPNPFNPSTTINYQVPEDAGGLAVSLNVYDIRGRLVRTLVKEVKGPGYYTAYWDGTNNHGQQVSSGVYFYRFSSEKYTLTRKMVLLK